MLKFVAIIFFLSYQSCTTVEFSDLRSFGNRLRDISLELFYFTEEENNGNIAMSPFTIWNLMSLVAFKTSEDSWKQLYSTFGISKQNGQYFSSIFKFQTESMIMKREGASFKSKYVLFCDASLQISRTFQRSILNSGTFMKVLNFTDNISAAKLANDFIQVSEYSYAPNQVVFDKTDFEESAMIVSGVVKFSGNWSLPFLKSNTYQKDGIHMMHQKAKIKYIDNELLGASVMELPYGKDEEYNMIIIRPHQNVEIKDILINLYTNISLANILNDLYAQDFQDIDVELPRFILNSVLMLNNPFISMDIGDVFLPGLANFSGISKEKMYISAFEHRTVVTVTETGTVVSASTPANLPNPAKDPQLGTVPPFLFFIVYQPSYSIVFCGKYGG